MSAPSVSSSSSTQPSSIAAKLEQAKRNREQQKIDSAQLKQQKQEEKQIQIAGGRRWEQRTAEETFISESDFTIYYCSYCNSHCIVTDTQLQNVPIRDEDGAYILLEEKHNVKLHLSQGEITCIKRTPTSVEKQYRYNCSKCHLFIAYRHTAWEEPSKVLYVLHDAVSRHSTTTPSTTTQQPQQQQTIQSNTKSSSSTDPLNATELDLLDAEIERLETQRQELMS